MVEQDLQATDPAGHQSTNADIEEDVSIGAAPEALAWASTRGGTGQSRHDALAYRMDAHHPDGSLP